MKETDIKEIYAKIENLSENEIKCMISTDASYGCAPVRGFTFPGVGIGAGILNCGTTNSTIEDICKSSIRKYSSKIKEIIRDNPKSTNYVLEIVMLLAPVVGKYDGQELK